jgi:hypothetical protein
VTAVNAPLKLPAVKNLVSEAEWRARVDLAACYRLIALYGWDDLIFTHISAKVPGTEDFLINPYGLMFHEITASSLVKVDLAGNKPALATVGEIAADLCAPHIDLGIGRDIQRFAVVILVGDDKPGDGGFAAQFLQIARPLTIAVLHVGQDIGRRHLIGVGQIAWFQALRTQPLTCRLGNRC